MTATKGETRARLLDTALGLFTVHGVEGTSLQMIADALGVTKAAVYYHFKTKDEITEAVAEPAVGELNTILDRAATIGRPGPRADFIIDGFVDLVIRNRVLVAVLCSDPGVRHGRRLTGTRGPGRPVVAPTPVRRHAPVAGPATAKALSACWRMSRVGVRIS